MPHIIVKAWPGKSEELKKKLAEALSQNVRDIFGSSEASVSVSIEDVQREDWMATVYNPEITNKPATLYKKPGYSSV